VRIARDRRGRGEAAAARIALDEVGEPCRARGGRDERVEVVLTQHLVDALATREAVVAGERLQIFLRVQAALLRGVHEVLLAEVRHHLVLVRLVERDDVGEGADLGIRRPLLQVQPPCRP
jgi:hypothetical protein